MPDDVSESSTGTMDFSTVTDISSSSFTDNTLSSNTEYYEKTTNLYTDFIDLTTTSPITAESKYRVKV